MMFLQPPPAPPVIVRILQEPVHETTVVDVLVGALGLTAVLLLIATAMGGVFGAVFILYRRMQARRRPYKPEAGAEIPHIV